MYVYSFINTKYSYSKRFPDTRHHDSIDPGLFCLNVGLNSLSLVRISITLNQTVLLSGKRWSILGLATGEAGYSPVY